MVDESLGAKFKRLSRESFLFVMVVMLLGVGVIVALMKLGGSGAESEFTVEGVVLTNDTGDFLAVTTNDGSEAAAPECEAVAYDRFGNELGREDFEVDEIEPGEQSEWTGHIQVDESVDDITVECD